MRYVAGVDMGGTNTKVGILNEEGEILRMSIIKTLSEKGHIKTLMRIWHEIRKLLGELSIGEDDLQGIGIGVPGPVTNHRVVLSLANLPWLENLDIAGLMEEISGKKTRIGNDTNLIALGEARYGTGKGYGISVTIAVGTGIGGGIFIKGEIYTGAFGAGGELGHMKVVRDGKLCGCGQQGCFEAYASATGLVKEAMSRLGKNSGNRLYEVIGGRLGKLEAKHIFSTALEGDTFSLDLLEYEAEWLAMGIGNVAAVINPEIVIISGGISGAGDFLLDKIRAKLPKYVYREAFRSLEIAVGKLGDKAGIIGSGALILDV